MRAFIAVSLVASLFACPVLLGADDQPDANALIAKALKAMGGEEKVAKLKIAAWKAKITPKDAGPNEMLDAEGDWHGFTKARLIGDLTEGNNNFKVQIVVNGKQAWIKKDAMVEDLSGDKFDFLTEIYYALRMIHLLPELKEKSFKLSPLGETSVNSQQAQGISISHPEHKPVSFYFAKETGLPLKSEIRLADPSGNEITLECLFSDYQDLGGIKHPRRITLKAGDGREIQVEISELQAKDKVDESAFARP